MAQGMICIGIFSLRKLEMFMQDNNDLSASNFAGLNKMLHLLFRL